MLTDNTLLVFVLTGGLILLALVQLFLAVRHDRAVTAAGPIEELAVYDKRLDEKRLMMIDLEEEIEKRRGAMAVVADLGAEVDGLRRQKDELLTEWESLREKREEVQVVRGDVEDAMIERQSLEAELIPLRAEYLSLKEQIEKAENLIKRTEEFRAEYQVVSEKVASMRSRLQRLEEAEKRVELLAAQETILERNVAQLNGQIAAQEQELSEVSIRVASERESLATTQTENCRIAAETDVKINEMGRVKRELEDLVETRGALEVRLAVLNEMNAAAESQTSEGADTNVDKLRELKVAPPVIEEMKGWRPAPIENEADALHRVNRRLEAKGLYYHARTLRAFHTTMKVNESTQMAILAGISGTGKSQLPRQYAAGIGIGFLQVPVQPRWDSPQDLMGFYNYIEGKFRPTDLARALWALDEVNNPDAVEDRMMLILLDEMNLARVEYYFSDFLSRLESRPATTAISDRNERKDSELELEIPNMKKPPRIFPGYNLLFAGTMNEDESTQSLSDKVTDRANVLRFAAPKKISATNADGKVEDPVALSRETWRGWIRAVSNAKDGLISQNLERMVEIMRAFNRPIGHRLGRAICSYVVNYPEIHDTHRIKDALSDQVEMRLLPKLRGMEIDRATTEFSDLKKFVDHDLEDSALAEAIEESIQKAMDATGQFVWTGVTR